MSGKQQKQQPEEPGEYVLVLRRKAGGLSIVEGEVPLSAVKVTKEHAPDTFDQAIGKLVTAIERRFLR